MLQDKEQLSLIAQNLNASVGMDIEKVAYDFVISLIREKASQIYDSYSLNEVNPLEVKFLNKDSMLEHVESDYGLIIRNLQYGIKKAIRLASLKTLEVKYLEKIVVDIERETWNFIYSKFILTTG